MYASQYTEMLPQVPCPRIFVSVYSILCLRGGHREQICLSYTCTFHDERYCRDDGKYVHPVPGSLRGRRPLRRPAQPAVSPRTCAVATDNTTDNTLVRQFKHYCRKQLLRPQLSVLVIYLWWVRPQRHQQSRFTVKFKRRISPSYSILLEI